MKTSLKISKKHLLYLIDLCITLCGYTVTLGLGKMNDNPYYKSYYISLHNKKGHTIAECGRTNKYKQLLNK